MPTAHRTVATCTSRVRLSDPTCLIGAEGYPMPETNTPVRWVSESPYVQNTILMATEKSCNGESCASLALSKTLILFWQPPGCLHQHQKAVKRTEEKEDRTIQDTMPNGHPTAAQWSQHLGCGQRHNPKSQVQLYGGDQT